MVSTRPPTSKYSSPLNNLLVTVPKAPITIGIIVTCMFHRFFNSLARSRLLLLLLFSNSFESFPTNVSWWSSPGVWVTVSLLKSPGLFSIVCPILIMQSLGWSLLVLLFSNPLVPVPILWWLYWAYQQRLVSTSLSYSIIISVFYRGLRTDLFFAFFEF